VVITDYWGAATTFSIPDTVVATAPTADQLQQLTDSGLISQIMVSHQFQFFLDGRRCLSVVKKYFSGLQIY
jgi:hypothetical protein